MATELARKGLTNELEFLQAIATSFTPNVLLRLPLLLDHFFTAGPHGEHLCLVFDLLSTDIGTFRHSAPGKALPLHIVQKVTADVVDALAALHSIDIIHTGLSTIYSRRLFVS